MDSVPATIFNPTLLHCGRRRIQPEAMFIRFLVFATVCLVSGRALADDVWSCSVIDEGKPQVIKFIVNKDTVAISDWRSRLMEKFDIGKGDALRLITNTKDAMVAVSDVRVNREAGTLQEVSMDTYAIDKKTAMLTITTANTGHAATEVKGNCAR
jgi:hypothetical protein